MNKPRLAKVARVRGELALLAFQMAASDGVIAGDELKIVEAALHDTVAVARAVDAGDALNRALGRSTEPRHIGTLAAAYQAAVDELPGPLSAT